jgi:hypothetical protein
MPAILGGVPEVDGVHVIVTKDGIAELVRYLAGVRSWIEAAQACLAPDGATVVPAPPRGRVVRVERVRPAPRPVPDDEACGP